MSTETTEERITRLRAWAETYRLRMKDGRGADTVYLVSGIDGHTLAVDDVEWLLQLAVVAPEPLESDGEPTVGSRVRDRDGDVWICGEDGRWDSNASAYPCSFDVIFKDYGPLYLIATSLAEGEGK